MKTLVVFKSKTGYTKQYAKWLAQELDCEAIELANLNNKKLLEADTLIYGGGIYASKISGLKSFLKRCSPAREKRIIIFSVGSAPNTEDISEMIRQKNRTEANADYPMFYLQGGFDPEKLSFFMKWMLSMVAKGIKKKMIKKPESVTKDDQIFLDFFQTTHSNMEKENLTPLIECVRQQ